MLVLNRKELESIQISDSVVVTVLTIRGGSVKLGIEAPRQIRVIRSELITAPTLFADCTPPTTRTLLPSPLGKSE